VEIKQAQSQGDSMMSLKKLDREMSKKAKQQQKRQRKLERRKAASKSFQEPRRDGFLAVVET
jgi:hypothetical protein